MSDRTKDQNVVWLRCFGILVVVFGHSIILYSSEWAIFSSSYDVLPLDIIKKIINLFQMPLLFSISGFCANYSKGTVGELIKKKITRLLIPYFVFCVAWLIPIREGIQYRWTTGNNISLMQRVFNVTILGRENGHLWYLPTLFLCFCVFCMLKSISQKKYAKFVKVAVWGVSSMFYILPISTIPIEYLNTFLQYYCWFYFGVVISHEKKKLQKIKWIWKVMSVVVLTVISLLTTRAIGVFGYFSAMSWLILLYSVNMKKNNSLVEKVAANSFGMYLLHSPLVYITYMYFNDAHPFWVIIVNFFVWGGVTLLVASIMRKTKFRVLLGEKM